MYIQKGSCVLRSSCADYETLRALDSDNVPNASSMSVEEISALPVHNYKVAGPQRLVMSFLFAYLSDSRAILFLLTLFNYRIT